MDKLKQAADFIRSKMDIQPKIAVVLGTGLGYFGELVQDALDIPYQDIPHFPLSTAPDHAGKMRIGSLGGKEVLVMQGRFHYYEGYSMQELAFPVRVLKLLGVQTLMVTNAVGAINESYQVGDLMMIADHIKFFNDTPLRGKNLDEFGPRFHDMSDAYSKRLRGLARKVAEEKQIPLKEGIYSYMPGPCFETPAEIRMLRLLGADVVGMSTVPEVITATHAGMEVFGLSFATNLAAGMLDKMEELHYTERSKQNFNELILGLIRSI